MKKMKRFWFFINLLVIILGKTLLKSDMLFFRLLIETGLGYTLTRSYAGFAGSVNRAFNTGSTKLMRALMGIFLFQLYLQLPFYLREGEEAMLFGLTQLT